MRTTRLLSLALTVALLAGGCGGPPPGGETTLRTAPLWMAEVDLPGCDARGALSGSNTFRELLLHPLDDQLVVATSNGAPTCVDLKDRLVAHTAEEGPGSWTQTSAVPVDDDPIPLVRERDSSPTGNPPGGETGEGNDESDDDPIPLVRLASGKPDDDPIPLVRERDLKNVQSTRKSELPNDAD